ncbi:MAG TPA: helix-turn-helix domain-containing protein [Vicinamibacterales bacterium]|nr:helix-turn-helix domain-containing protein [Vicinamibacterales bacterium]
MTATNADWIQHPGAYIREEMEERGWLQRDLAFILGAPEQAVTMILNGKRGISADMAKALGDAFDVAPEFFANLQQAYGMAQARNPYSGVQERRRMQSVYPVREMIQRGWIVASDATMLEAQLARFFGVPDAGEIPYMAHAAKKTLYEEREIRPAQLVWLFRVRQIAQNIAATAYSEKALRAAVTDLEGLLYSPDGVRNVPRILAECGVRLIFVEKLPGAEIDGVCFWLDSKSPVIGMSLTRDRIDNFWFVLRHEIEHILQRHGQEQEIIDVNVEAPESNVSDDERIANEAAANFCVALAKFDSFMVRKHPFYYEKDVVAFARLLQRHPGLVIGRMRKQLNRWDYLTRHLVKVRHLVLPGAIADGWGRTVPMSL